MARVVLGNHSAVMVPRSDREGIRRFYRDVLGCTFVRETDLKDDVRIGDDFYIAFLYADEGVALDEADFLRAIFLEVQADNVTEMREKIVASGVKVLDVADPHLYFQAPGGQVLRLVGIDEDLSQYEGTDALDDTTRRLLDAHPNAADRKYEEP